MPTASRPTPIVDIVIPTFGQEGFTLKCFESLARTLAPGDARVIWVDNGSHPMNRVALAEKISRLALPTLPIFLDDNLGFVKATNAGIAVSTAPYVLLLNNDTEMPEGWLKAFLDVMVAEPKVGIVGPLSSSSHQWQGNVPLTTKAPGYGLLSRVSMLAFFCSLIRREVIVECGYLSEEYRAGLGDDDDYCERVKRAGWRLALRTDLVVKHHHRTTFRAIYGEGGWLPYQNENIAHFKRKWGVS